MQTGAPIWAEILWHASALILAILGDLAGPGPPRPFLGLFFESSEVLVGWTTSSNWLAGATCPTTVLVGISMVWALKLCRQIGTLEDPGCNSPWVTISITAAGIWGPSTGSVSTWTLIQCPLTLKLAHTLTVLKGVWSPLVHTLTVLKGGMVTFHVVQTGPLTSSRQNFLTSMRSPTEEVQWSLLT